MHGEPQFTKIGSRVQCLVYYRTIDGIRRRMKASGRSRVESFEKLSAKFEDYRRASPDALVSGDTTIGELSELWLASLRHKAPDTITAYTNRCRISIVPYIGNKPIRLATTGYLETHLRRIADGGVTTLTSKNGRTRDVKTGGLTAEKTARVVLKLMFDFALSYRALPDGTNPVAKDGSAKERQALRAPARSLSRSEYVEMRRRIKAWQDAQQFGPPRGKHLLDAVDVLLGTGVRTGELLAMRWNHLWLEDEIPFVMVTHTVTSKGVQDYTKGNTAQIKLARPIALPAYVVSVLSQRKEAAGRKGQGFVFPNAKGGHFTTSNFRRSWNDARSFDAQNGDDFAWISPKSMRKSAATLVARTSGLQAAADQLRHSSPNITEEFYVEQLLQMVDNRAAFDGIFHDGDLMQ